MRLSEDMERLTVHDLAAFLNRARRAGASGDTELVLVRRRGAGFTVEAEFTTLDSGPGIEAALISAPAVNDVDVDVDGEA